MGDAKKMKLESFIPARGGHRYYMWAANLRVRLGQTTCEVESDWTYPDAPKEGKPGSRDRGKTEEG